MQVLIAAVGRFRRDPARSLYEAYVARLRWPVTLKEIEERGARSAPERMAREAERLLAAVPERADLVALDEAGKNLDSRAFAAWLGARQDEGSSTLAS